MLTDHHIDKHHSGGTLVYRGDTQREPQTVLRSFVETVATSYPLIILDV